MSLHQNYSKLLSSDQHASISSPNVFRDIRPQHTLTNTRTHTPTTRRIAIPPDGGNTIVTAGKALNPNTLRVLMMTSPTRINVVSASAVCTEFATSSRRLPTDSVDNLETNINSLIILTTTVITLVILHSAKRAARTT